MLTALCVVASINQSLHHISSVVMMSCILSRPRVETPCCTTSRIPPPQVFSVIYGYGPLLPFPHTPPKVIGPSRKQGWRQVCSRVTQLHSGSQEQPTRVLTPLSVKRPSRSKQQGFRLTSPEIMVGVEKFRFPIGTYGFRTAETLIYI